MILTTGDGCQRYTSAPVSIHYTSACRNIIDYTRAAELINNYNIDKLELDTNQEMI